MPIAIGDQVYEDGLDYEVSKLGLTDGPTVPPQGSVEPVDDGMLGYKIRTELFEGEDSYFKSNPHVTGMAAETGDVILNPYASADVNKDSVARNEALRLHLRDNKTEPSFSITDEQRKAFVGTAYEKNDTDLKSTIAARIYAGDPSAKATEEQKQWLSTYLKRPLQGSTEPAGALKTSGGMETPDNRSVLEKLTGSDGQERYQTWPEKAVRGVLGAMALPGEVSMGMEEPDSITSIERIADLAGFITTAPAPVAKKLVDGTLGSFAGVRSKTFDKNRLAEAQIMKADGKDVDEVFAKTGAFQGADGRWRQEIDDSKLKFDKYWKDGGEVKLSEALDHPELYKAYPDLKDVKLVYDPEVQGAYADFNRNEIVTGTKYAQDPGILMHEVQHMIQHREGFAQGGMPKKATTEYRLKYQKDFESLKPEMEKLLEVFNKSVEGKGVITKQEIERLKYLSKVSKTYADYVKEADKQAAEYYMRLAGETEARNVDTRLQMKDSERRKLHPRWTEDVNIQGQIVRDEVVGTTAYGLWDSKGHITKPRKD